MIALRADLKVVLATQPVDFRKSVHTLSALVSEALHVNPYCGDVFVFRSKRMDRVKLLAWESFWRGTARFTLPRQRLRSIPQTTFATNPQTKRQNLANSNTAKSPISDAVQGVPCSSRTTNPAYAFTVASGRMDDGLPKKRASCSRRSASHNRPTGISTSSYPSTWSRVTFRRRRQPSARPIGRRRSA